MEKISIKPAEKEQCDELSALAIASKKFWGYPEEWVDLWRADLTITPEYLSENHVFCAWNHERTIGFCGLARDAGEWELDHLWVHPNFMGRGVGGELLRRATDFAVKKYGAKSLRIVSDPNAETFYLNQGAERIGEIPSQPNNRILPVLSLPLPLK